MKKTYKIEVDCANCAAKMEQAACRTPGVAAATVGFMAQKMSVTFEEGMELVVKNCKVVEDDCVIYI